MEIMARPVNLLMDVFSTPFMGIKIKGTIPTIK